MGPGSPGGRTGLSLPGSLSLRHLHALRRCLGSVPGQMTRQEPDLRVPPPTQLPRQTSPPPAPPQMCTWRLLPRKPPELQRGGFRAKPDVLRLSVTASYVCRHKTCAPPPFPGGLAGTASEKNTSVCLLYSHTHDNFRHRTWVFHTPSTSLGHQLGVPGLDPILTLTGVGTDPSSEGLRPTSDANGESRGTTCTGSPQWREPPPPRAPSFAGTAPRTRGNAYVHLPVC